MQDVPLTVGRLLPALETRFAERRIVEREADPASGHVRTTTTTWGQVVHDARRVAAALDDLGVQLSDRVATFGWNTRRHLELFLAVPGSGGVLHTVNHRLAAQQIAYVLDHAEDRVVFVDRSLLATVWDVVAERPALRHIVVVPDGSLDEVPDDPRVAAYDDLVAGASGVHPLVVDDERTAATLCYTSGTTGDPKGVLYDHRSVVLHALMLLAVDSFAVCEADVVLPMVPMFHVNAWGLPYAAAMAGSGLSLPGAARQPADLATAIVEDRVTVTGAVTSVWRSLLPELRGRDLSHLRKAVCGGGPVPDDLAAEYEEELGLTLTGAWGMTETSPLVTHARSHPEGAPATLRARREILTAAGRPVPLVEVRVVTEDGPVPHDGASRGELQVTGPTIASGYYRAERPAVTDDGWLPTGDVATIDAHGVVRIVDRTKDLIKSGGEWISSIDLENAIMDHPDVEEAAVVGVEDDTWSERPHAWVVPHPGRSVDLASVRAFLDGRVARWWLPDSVTTTSALPRTATGKVSKLALRQLQPGAATTRTTDPTDPSTGGQA